MSHDFDNTSSSLGGLLRVPHLVKISTGHLLSSGTRLKEHRYVQSLKRRVLNMNLVLD